MIVLLIWLAGCAAIGYWMSVAHMWRDMLAGFASFLFLLWVLGGAAFISRKLQGGTSKFSTANEWKKAAAAASERQRAAEAVRESVK